MDSNQQMQGPSEAIVYDSTDTNRPALLFVGANKPVQKYLWLSPSLQTSGSAQRKRDRRTMSRSRQHQHFTRLQAVR